MKLSLNLQDEEQQKNPLLKAKVPIFIFNQPFISSLTTRAIITSTKSKSNDASSDLSFSLSTNFPSGPSLKFSYTPTKTPFSLSLKSGLGLFGSPHDSSLVFSANFSISPTNPTNVTPFFRLHFKPQFGDFSLRKTTTSNPNQIPSSGSNSVYRFQSQSESGSNEERVGWQELKLEPYGNSVNGFKNPNPNPNYLNGVESASESPMLLKESKYGGFSSGISVMAKTEFPLTKRVSVNLRWGMNAPTDSFSKMPYLTLNKIAIQRIEETKEIEKEKGKEKINENGVNDMELLKGTYFLMKRDLDLLQKENKDMRLSLEDIRSGTSRYNKNGVGKKVSTPSNGNSVEFEKWKSKKNAEEDKNGRELKKPVNHVSDFENELQKAIMAASS